MVLTRYRHLVFQNRIGPPTGQALRKLEHETGARLTTGFRDFLNAANGALMAYCLPIAIDGRPKTLRSFRMFSTDRKRPSRRMSFWYQLDQARAQGCPRHWLPLAEDHDEATRLFLDLETPRNQRVLALVPSRNRITVTRPNDINEYWTQYDVIELAANFNHFLTDLTPDFDVYLLNLDYASETADPAALDHMIRFLDLAVPEWRTLSDFSAWRDLQPARLVKRPDKQVVNL